MIRKIFAVASAAAIALSLATLPAVAAGAAESDAAESVTCNALGYATADGPTGSHLLNSGGTTAGMISWLATSVLTSLQPGWTIDLCVTGTAAYGTVEHPGITGGAEIPVGETVGQVGWKNLRLTEPGPLPLAASYGMTDEYCEGGVLHTPTITLGLDPAVVFSLTGPNGAVALVDGIATDLPVGAYRLVAGDADPEDGFTVTPLDTTLVIYGGPGFCLDPPDPANPVVVAPIVRVIDQTCQAGALVDGRIVVDIFHSPGVAFQIEDGTIPFDPAGTTWDALAPGDYVVTAYDYDLDDGWILDGPFSETVTIAAGTCPGDPGPVVVPAVTTTDVAEQRAPTFVTAFASDVQESCTAGAASFTIGNDQGTGAVSWTLDGDAIAEGAHAVVAPSTVHLVATTNGSEFGFAEGTPTEWTIEFAPLAACELQTFALQTPGLRTLALTGVDRTVSLTAGVLIGITGIVFAGAWIRRETHGV